MIIVSRGTDFRDDSFDVIFERNCARREGLDWVDSIDFDRSDGEWLKCGDLEYNRMLLRLGSVGEGEDRRNFLVDTMTERSKTSLEPLGDREWPCYQV